MVNLQTILVQHGLVQPPEHSRNSGTSGNYTRCNMQHWPPIEKRHIAWLGEFLSCKRFDTQDKDGWNILHHVCHQSSSCAPMLDIILQLANPHKPQLEGSLEVAWKQTTVNYDPYGWTPLHFFCMNGDVHGNKHYVVKELLENGLVQPADFDIKNPKVYLLLLNMAPPAPPVRLSAK